MIWYWTAFLLLVFAMLAIDLGLLNRENHKIGFREAIAWTGVWVAAALLFNVFIYFAYEAHWLGIGRGGDEPLDGGTAAIQFLTAYLVEKSLSLDNIFVFAVIFRYFAVPDKYQHRVLFWGIMGALILRGVMIAAGSALIANFSWVIYVFGVILLWTAYRLATAHAEATDMENNRLVRLARRLYPVYPGYAQDRFFTTLPDGRRAMTTLFIVLLVVESSDVLFAVDSIPAVFAVTRDPFIVFTSNIFAILGLRALYFALAGVLDMFHHLKKALVILLAYIGVKMLLSHHYPVPPGVSLGIICAILGAGIAASLLFPKGIDAAAEAAGVEEPVTAEPAVAEPLLIAREEAEERA